MADEYYIKALKMAQKSYQRNIAQGSYPYLQVLEELLSHIDVVAEEKLGVISIPSELIVGTVTAGRRTAFAPNFMPLLSPGSEFAAKWSSLCEAHLEEGIRDPIKCYEFMNRYYVLEGNKRVSVLKFFDSPTIEGNVTRMIPKRSESVENRLYFEYLDFYRRSKANYIIFTKLGSYKHFLELVGMEGTEEWTEEERLDIRSFYVRFEKAYLDKSGKKPPIPVADAMLVYLKFYPLSNYAEDRFVQDIKEGLTAIWDEIVLQSKEKPAEILMEPAEAPKKNLLEMILSPGNKKLRIAFIHDKSAQTSSWTYGHELGRMYLEQQFKDKVETLCFDNVTLGKGLEEAFDKAIAQKSDIIFTTTPQFLDTSIKMAVQYPSVKILNCSVDTTHQCIRTYYARLYEGKFLCGMVAGALSANGKIGYLADYPISGMIANINAFAIGAKMMNPRATVQLEWTTVRDKDEIIADFKANGIDYVSCQAMIVPDAPSRMFGLINIEKDEPENICATMWNWGNLYKKLTEAVWNGAWESVVTDATALNYWWGMSAGVVDFICSDKVPEKTKQLIDFIQQEIIEGGYHPFRGVLTSQTGVVQSDRNSQLSPEEIINMSWLADNVIGKLPHWNKLNDSAKAIVEIQGVDNIDK